MDPNDFWSQVRRTVDGKPVAENQIRMIVEAIVSALDLGAGDVLLDLACGNGALSSRLFDSVGAYLGVDSSEYLIGVAKKHFEAVPHRRFALDDVATYAAVEPQPERFTKALCYGSFSYFPEETAQRVLRLLSSRFPRVSRLFIGNLPDRERLARFYVTTPPAEGEIRDPRSQIGIWRSQEEFRSLAQTCGWHAEFRMMPESFYAAAYRYDALLTRPE